MEMPKPSIDHKKLQSLVGEWEGTEKIHVSPMGPVGFNSIGRISNKSALDGFALFHDYEQERDDKTHFRGHGIITWNSREQCYIMYWFHPSDVPPSFFKGTLVNDIMILNTEDTQTKVRITWDFQRNHQYTSRIETSQDGENWYPFIEGIYYRMNQPR